MICSHMWIQDSLQETMRYIRRKPSYDDGVMTLKHFPRYWPFVRGIHRSSVDCSNKGPLTRGFDVSLRLIRSNYWETTRMGCDLGRHVTSLWCNANVNVTGGTRGGGTILSSFQWSQQGINRSFQVGFNISPHPCWDMTQCWRTQWVIKIMVL